MDDNILNTPGLMDPGTEFGNIMKHAMGIKSAQMEQDRKKWETWPTFLQNSMWERNEEALRLRDLPASERLEGAAKIKEQGNDFFKRQKFSSAVECYEAAVGVFRYAKQLDPDWKKKGIKDESIELRDERGSPEIDAFCVSLYNNLAASYLARATAGKPEPGGTIDGDYKLCCQASTFGIEIEKTGKALYRRARALSEPMTATDEHIDMAINDLASALELEPDDKGVRTMLNKLKKGRAAARAKDKSALSGMFSKSELYDQKTLDGMAKREAEAKRAQEYAMNGHKSGPRTAEDAEREAKEAEQAVAHLREKGRHADADSLERKIVAHRQQLEEAKRAMAEEEERVKRNDPRYMDFSNPTKEQVEEAAKQGIDLYDPMVVRELQRLQKDKEFNGEEGEEEGEEGEEGEEDEDVDAAAARRQRMRRQRAEQMSGNKPAAQDGLSPQTKYIIMAATFAIGIYRIWAMLGPQWMAGLGNTPHNERVPPTVMETPGMGEGWDKGEM